LKKQILSLYPRQPIEIFMKKMDYFMMIENQCAKIQKQNQKDLLPGKFFLNFYF